MNKLLYSFVFVLSFFSAHAQSQNPQEEIQTLVQRVDSLEHELSYLKLTYELNALNSEIKMFANEVHSRYIAIKSDLLNQNFDSQLGASYQLYYETCQHQKQAISELIDAKKISFTLTIITHPYSENELSTLKSSSNLINSTYNSLEHSLKLLEITVNAYNESL